mgnify:CR=1 FL=1
MKEITVLLQLIDKMNSFVFMFEENFRCLLIFIWKINNLLSHFFRLLIVRLLFFFFLLVFIIVLLHFFFAFFRSFTYFCILIQSHIVQTNYSSVPNL